MTVRGASCVYGSKYENLHGRLQVRTENNAASVCVKLKTFPILLVSLRSVLRMARTCPTKLSSFPL